MKNFRKSIIALATAAAMLIPSVAMAATLTTTVDKDIDGDVYVGFYDGAVLKDVVKTTVTDATVTDAAAAEEATELPATVEMIVEDKVNSRADGAVTYRLAVKATVDDEITAINGMFSYDQDVVQIVKTNKKSDDSSLADGAYKFYKGTYYDEDEEETYNIGFSEVKGNTTTVNGREAIYLTFRPEDDCEGAGWDNNFAEGQEIFEVHYRIKEGKTVTANTFRFETEIGEGTINNAIGSKGSEVGFKLASKSGGYTYGCWNNGTAVADTIKLVTPWDAPVIPEVTTKTLSVEVPAGAEGYAATMFIWDENQIAQCDPITEFTKN